MIVVALLSLPFLFVLVRKPVLRRLALRNAVRRPRETALVILGSLLGTAIMTGSFVVGDTFNSSIRRIAYEQLGPVDEIVSANGLAAAPRPRGPARRPARPEHRRHARADRDRPRRRRRRRAPVRAAPKAQLLETDFAAAARSSAAIAHATGISGATPGAGRGRDRSRSREHARTSSPATPSTRSRTASRLRLRVDRASCPKLGVAGYWSGDETASNNVFVRAGNDRRHRGARARRRRPRRRSRSCSCRTRGGVEAGAQRTAAVDTRCSRPHLGGVAASVNDRKQAVLDRAERSGQSLSRLYTSLGTFAVLAGILLLVNIFFMLADERKSELGMLRAVGLRRLVARRRVRGRRLVLRGALRDRGNVRRARARPRARWPRRRSSSRGAATTPASRCTSRSSGRACSAGLVVGFVIAIATVVVTSVWLSRFNIIQAIRDITEPARRRPHRRSSYLGIVGAVVGLLADRGRRPRARRSSRSCSARSSCSSGIAPMLARNFPRTLVNTVDRRARARVGGRRRPGRDRARHVRRRVAVRRPGPRARRRRGRAHRAAPTGDRSRDRAGREAIARRCASASRTRWRGASARR